LTRIEIRRHAFQRMAARGISVADVLTVLRVGELIEDYPDDTPFPSRLLLGTASGRPLHVVAAHDTAADVTYVVTTYQPDPSEWDAEFKRRRQ
jgi:hypothetical protein